MIDTGDDGVIQLDEFTDFVKAELELQEIESHMATSDAGTQQAMVEAAHRGARFHHRNSVVHRVKLQGDVEMMTKEAMGQRQGLKGAGQVADVIKAWWDSLQAIGIESKERKERIDAAEKIAAAAKKEGAAEKSARARSNWMKATKVRSALTAFGATEHGQDRSLEHGDYVITDGMSKGQFFVMMRSIQKVCATPRTQLCSTPLARSLTHKSSSAVTRDARRRPV
jgi:hypothetical protein